MQPRHGGIAGLPLGRPGLTAGCMLALALMALAGCGDANSQTAAVRADDGSCTATYSPGSSWSSVSGALAAGGSTVCLSEGHYPEETLADLAPSSNSTLTAAPGAKVTLAGLTVEGDDPASEHLRVEDIYFTGAVVVREYGSHIAFRHDTIDGRGREIGGFEALGSEAVGESYINFEYNRLEHLECGPSCSAPTGQCGTFIGNVSHITFSHNVCGPYISAHYTQAGSIQHLSEEYNTFLGPSARYLTKTPEDQEGAHQNVLQVFHSSEYVTFSNNVIRNTGANGNTILFENTPEAGAGRSTFSHSVLENNLFERDGDGQGPGFCPQDGMTYRHNTEILSIPEGNFAGTVFSKQGPATETSGCAPARDYAIEHNLWVEIPCTHVAAGFGHGQGQACQGSATTDLAYAGTGPGLACETSCRVDYNVTSDGSADTGGSNHYVTDWAPTSNEWWSRRFTQTKAGPYGLESEDWTPIGLPFQAGYEGGGGAPASAGVRTRHLPVPKLQHQ